MSLVIYKRHKFDVYSNLKVDIRIVQDNAETIILNDNHGIKGKGVRSVDIQLMEIDNATPLRLTISVLLYSHGYNLLDSRIVRIDRRIYNTVCRHLKNIMSSDDKFYTCLRNIDRMYVFARLLNPCKAVDLEKLEPVEVEPTEDEKRQHALAKEFLNLWKKNSLSKDDTIYLELE